MAKISRGRIVIERARFSGLAGMDSNSSEELNEWGLKLLLRYRLGNLVPTYDHPRWILGRAIRLFCLAERKERALEHKAGQKNAVGSRAIVLNRLEPRSVATSLKSLVQVNEMA